MRAFVLKSLLLRRTQIFRENHRLGSVLNQPAIGGVAPARQRPRASIDGTETLDAAKRAPTGILDNVFRDAGISGAPFCATRSVGPVLLKDFSGRCSPS